MMRTHASQVILDERELFRFCRLNLGVAMPVTRHAAAAQSIQFGSLAAVMEVHGPTPVKTTCTHRARRGLSLEPGKRPAS